MWLPAASLAQRQAGYPSVASKWNHHRGICICNLARMAGNSACVEKIHRACWESWTLIPNGSFKGDFIFALGSIPAKVPSSCLDLGCRAGSARYVNLRGEIVSLRGCGGSCAGRRRWRGRGGRIRCSFLRSRVCRRCRSGVRRSASRRRVRFARGVRGRR